MKQLPAGVQAPDFTLKTLDGRAFHLTEAVAAGPIALVFYKASCPTCQLTFPYLQQIHSNSNALIVGISQDEPEETQAFVDRFGIAFDILIDEHPYDVSMVYGLQFVPTTFIIGKDGGIELSDYGFSKATLSTIAGFNVFPVDDGLPATRPG